MRKNINVLLILGIAFTVLISISCKSTSTPPPPDSGPKIEQVRQIEQPSYKIAADKARQRAMDFGAPAYFPSEWETAEVQYSTAGDANSYNVVTTVYDRLFERALPLYAQAREDEIMAAREQLISSGFSKAFPQYLKKADDMALAAHEEYEAGDYYKAKDSSDAALSEYETLIMGAKIMTTRQEIIDRGFRQYDSDNFQKADEVLRAALRAYEEGNDSAVAAEGEEALLRYNLVLSNGWVAYASDRRLAAVEEREAAVFERTNIASRDTFRVAETYYSQAEVDFESEKYREAGLGYIEAEARFAVSRKETEEKRLRAEEAIRIAEEKIEESSGSAIEAERIIEGGSK
jgi:hypothetical protein